MKVETTKGASIDSRGTTATTVFLETELDNFRKSLNLDKIENNVNKLSKGIVV